MKSEIDLLNLCHELAVEGVTGAISFKSPFYKTVCSELGIKYKDLSRLGKAVLKADAIDSLNSSREQHRFKEGKYYADL